MSALDLIKGKCSRIIRANLSNDTYCVIDNDVELEKKHTYEIRNNFRQTWNSYVNLEYVYPEDVFDFAEYVNMDFISAFLRKYHGKEPYEFKYRYLKGEEYHPVYLEIIPTEDYSQDNQDVYIFLKEVGHKLYDDYVHFGDLLRGLSENYGAIYFVDFEEDKIHPFRIYPAIEKLYGNYFRSNPSYGEAMETYISSIVKEEDKDEMRSVTQYEFLKEQLKDSIAYSHEYRVQRNGRELVFRFKIANLEGVGKLRKAVMGFADVSSEKTMEFCVYHVGKRILVAQEYKEDAQQLKKILSSQYEVVIASSCQEALDILDGGFEDIAVVLTDLHLPGASGYELIRRMKRIRQYSLIPVVVTLNADLSDSKSILERQAACLEMDVADFILKPFNQDVILKRIGSIVQLRESTSIISSMEKDTLTGLYSKDFFFREVEHQLKTYPDEKYVMWVCDIQGLKVINEKYGIETGDEILRKLATSRAPFEGMLICGRTEGDKLAALILESSLPFVYESTKTADLGLSFPIPNVVIKSGIYHIRNRSSLRPQGMYDRALLAMQKIKNSYGIYIAEYDDVIRKDLLVQRQVAENAENALVEHQFIVYYQPKYDLHDKCTNGAEALVRWVHPELGFMNPGVFIPLFEQNGFICKLDYYVWEEVCKSLKEWKDKGMRLVPISVNVSRRDFENEMLAENVLALLDKYGVDPSLFHVEVTESAYSDNPQRISEIIKKFHDNGFVVELDDFGAGYSSMTALSELDLDIMKLDMSLIRKDDPTSSKSVLEFSMQLAKMMQLKTVAEGVETEAQVNRISSLGGDYIQGYFYSKPLSKEAFEVYLTNEVGQ